MQENVISLIVPIYNAERYLDQCVESIVMQTYNFLEIILVNDGSTDDSLKICNKWKKKDSRIIVVDKKNGGVSSARNAGIEIATGKYLLFVDSDDYLDLDYVKKISNYNLLGNNNMVMCKLRRFNNKGFIDCNGDSDIINEYNENQFIEIYIKRLLNPPFCKIYNRNIITENNIRFDESLSLGEDLLFNLEYLKYVKKIFLLDNALYNYRVGNSNSLSKKYYADMFAIQNKLCDRFREIFNSIDPDLLNIESLDFYTTIVSNEFHNKNVNLFKRYFNVRKMLSNKIIVKRLEEYKNSIKKYNYFLLKNKFYITYIFLKKFNQLKK